MALFSQDQLEAIAGALGNLVMHNTYCRLLVGRRIKTPSD